MILLEMEIDAATIQVNVYLLIVLVGLILVLVGYSLWMGKRNTQKLIDEHINIDPISGYGNFARFVDDAEIMLKYKDVNYVVGVIDISNFKAINDYYGRNQGDRILKSVADRIHDIIMPDGIFTRMFADRFVFVINFLDINSLKYIIETYLEDIEFEIEELREVIKINCNCGMYIIEDYGEDVNMMIDKAAIASKLSKKSISKMVTILDNNINYDIARKQKLTYKMSKALNNHEFVPYIQPKVSFRDGHIVGGEALVRWMSPEDGMIAPNDFIPLFEQNGFVNKVDFYMLERICAMIKKRSEWGRYTVPISVNQSRMHVYDTVYINKLINTFDKYGINKNNIVFELTESAFTENTDDMIDLIRRMSKLGYNISMDDFGCGYSSLNMLNLLPISELKLDKQFLDDESEKSRYIIKSIVNLAHGLGIKIVCEGVETAEQVEFLTNIGCDIAQGYYYAKPMPMNEFEKLLDGDVCLLR